MINLDGVTSLHISSNAKVSSFMGSISAPHLKDLVVRFPSHNADFLRSLRALIARSGCAESIKRFCFVGYIPSEKEMVRFLSELHNLSELDVVIDKHAPFFSNIFLSALYSPAPARARSGPSSRRLLPNVLSLRSYCSRQPYIFGYA